MGFLIDAVDESGIGPRADKRAFTNLAEIIVHTYPNAGFMQACR